MKLNSRLDEDVYFSPLKSSFECISVRVNRELGVPVSQPQAQLIDSFDPRVIQRTSKIVDGIPENYSDVSESLGGVFKLIFDELLTCVGVDLNRGSISLLQCAESRIKVQDVLIGPLNLSSSLRESHGPNSTTISQ